MRCIKTILLFPALLGLSVLLPVAPVVGGQTDLDAFMQQVLARRDDNWKKLQQYILDEREQIEVRGPGRVRVWGEDREYTWYIRDGFFVRSPLKSNGVTIGEADRRQYESDFIRREQARDKRASEQSSRRAAAPPDDQPSPSADSLIRQTRQPEFISSAYFLRFRFEQGKYAFVGREQLDGRDVLHIEYYPENLYSHRQSRRLATDHDPKDPWDGEMQRLLNKVALVSLWVEPESHQIVKYTLDNIGFDFLPAQWLVRVTEFRGTMTMGQPFAGVWLPRGVEMNAGLTLAVGQFDVRYVLDYHDYKLADVTTKVRLR